jgi:hypothetical protein
MHSKANAIIIPEPEPKGTPPLCHREQLQIGHWIPELQDEPPYISRTTHLRCANYNFEEQPLQPYLSYNWMPRDKSCHFTSWNATEFCRLLPYSTVSIIGDSLSWEHYSSMLQLLGAPVRQSHQHKSRTFHMNIAQISCRADGHATRFVFRNDPRLSPQTVIDSIERDFPTVLVLNRGAHYDDDDILIQDIRNLLPTLLDWKVRCKRLDFRCHLFWRTTVPGHPGCAPSWASVSNQTRERIDWSRPATVRSFIETWIATQSNYNETTWNYHWYDFQRQNKLILNEFQLYSQTQGLEYEVLDAYDLNVLRLESHRWHQGDCLHNCYPGTKSKNVDMRMGENFNLNMHFLFLR